ncbi:MAG: hypothetical protein CM15mP120_19880 [Pseudomonadota bacterium]|nr:MAG: hypothetical protein CM15mP120_19880 [Pseudomonadota bacterium]
MQSGENVYDAYVNDSDLIGTHSRYGYVVALSDFMAGEGAEVTSPTLDLQDFIGISLPRDLTAKFISCRISSSLIYIGFATTGSVTLICKRNSQRSTVTRLGCQ